MNLPEILYASRDAKDKLSEEEDYFTWVLRQPPSKSQNFQDLFVLYELKNRNLAWKPHFCVEFGGGDGKTDSNTWMLNYNKGWQRLTFEPILDGICIWDTTGDKLDFTVTEDPYLSTVTSYVNSDYNANLRQNNTKQIKVDTITLYDALNKHKAPEEIAYMSVDTEGTEYRILRKFFEQNDKYKVNIFTIEHNYNESNRSLLRELMNKNGYDLRFPQFSRWDDFFVRRNW